MPKSPLKPPDGKRVPVVQVSLDRGGSLNGLPATRFAVTLLGQMAAALKSGRPLVLARDVLVSTSSHEAFAMALSRAFRLFQTAGVGVGWGAEFDADGHQLPLRGRVHGPFWLRPQELNRLHFMVNGKAVDIEAWVAQSRQGNSEPSDAMGSEAAIQDRLNTWMHTLVLRQMAEEGRLTAAQAKRAFGGMAASSARDGEGQSSDIWALMLQARYARLGNEITEARQLYVRLLQRCQKAALIHQPARLRLDIVEALAEIGVAWCDQQTSNSVSAWRRLQRLSPRFEPTPGERSLWMSSRLAGEYFNLRALVGRAMLLDRHASTGDAVAADGVLRDFELALQCAVESDSLTLMEAVSSNLGYTLWLLPQALDSVPTRIQAIQWILVGESLCNRHGIGSGSYWNIIYLCRVARGAPAHGAVGTQLGSAAARAPASRSRLHLRALQARALPLHRLRELMATRASGPDLRALCDLLLPPHMKDWLALTQRMLATVLDEEVNAQPVQRAAAMLEYLWQLVLAEHTDDALEIQGQLRQLLPALGAKQRKYLSYELGQIPL